MALFMLLSSSLTRFHAQTRRLQKELQAEHDLAHRELQEAGRRLQQDCDHRVALERDKVRQVEEERVRLLQQVQTQRMVVMATSLLWTDEVTI